MTKRNREERGQRRVKGITEWMKARKRRKAKQKGTQERR